MSIELNQQLQPSLQTRVTPKQIAANAILAAISPDCTVSGNYQGEGALHA